MWKTVKTQVNKNFRPTGLEDTGSLSEQKREGDIEISGACLSRKERATYKMKI